MHPKIWMMPPWGRGEPKEMEATPEVLVPAMVAGWSQCQAPPAPTNDKEVNAE